MECPVCGKEMPGDTCSCGYDRTQDYLRYPTLSEVEHGEEFTIEAVEQVPAAAQKKQYVDRTVSYHSSPKQQNQAYSDPRAEYHKLKDSRKIANILLYMDLFIRFLWCCHFAFSVADMDSHPEIGDVAFVYLLVAAFGAFISCPRGFVHNHSEKHSPGAVAAWTTIPIWFIWACILGILAMNAGSEDLIIAAGVFTGLPSMYFVFSNIDWLQWR